ncbi:Yip1 family protein [Streptomyces sp. UH6]|uniref:Yip1 family protein n=1 Tax=Streptomyces sp. UH6 TaxID=2748379 RepID=UPI0015D4E89E|nr:YIP1 family protein [Streptomyces sp. UH6]
MSHLGSKAVPIPHVRTRPPAGAGTFEGVAGFRIGRGGRDRAPQGQQTHGQRQPYGQQQQSYGQQPYGQPGHPGQPSYGYPPQNAPRPPYGGGGGYGAPGGDGPEYFDDGPHHPQHPQHPGPAYGGGRPQQGHGRPHQGHDPYAANNPGHTQAFSVDPNADPYAAQYGDADAPSGPIGPPLHWKDLLKGIVLSPNQTFLRMRDYRMWGPALTVAFVYGLLAVFGFDGAREDAIEATLNTAIPIVLATGVAMTLSSFILGVVTHTVARQLGGNGAWQPTVGLSMLIMCLSDAPRLVVAIFMGGDAAVVQVLGWLTWLAGGALLTLMVTRSHEIAWPKALGASAIQLIALLSIVKLGTF